MKKKIFLSYSHKDKVFAKKIATDLKKAGYKVWWDISAIEGGDRWAKEIQDGINGSDILALIVSPSSIISEWVEKEFIFASRRGMKIVPLLYAHCELPIWLLNLQYIDLIGDENYAQNFQQVIESFEKYGRREGDAKALPPKKNTPISGISSSWLLLSIITILIVLLGAYFTFLQPQVTPAIQPTNTKIALSTKTNIPISTATETNTSIPVTETKTGMPTLKPTGVDEETPIPSQTATRTPAPSETPTLDGLAPVKTDASGAEMLLVEAGTFLMGSDASAADEKPAHIVNLSDYYIDKYEVTNADYKICVDSLACSLPKTTTFYISSIYRNHPVVFVNWEKASEYCEWRDARLPTEAEWEKAARSSETLNYPWGNVFNGNALNFCDLECSYDWADKSYRDRYTMTAPIGTYPDGASAYGVFDMAGNVSEWVADWYADDYYPNSPTLDPLGPESGIYRVLRGGSWYDRKLNLRTFKRIQLRPNVSYNYTGFRCAGDAK